MDLQARIDHARHPFGPNFRIYTEATVPAPDLETVREAPPAAQAVASALLHAGCLSVATWVPTVLVGYMRDSEPIEATGTPSGWLLTGGPHNLLNYGVPDTAALERFPDVLASVQEHARSLSARGVR